jgi:ribonuclease D
MTGSLPGDRMRPEKKEEFRNNITKEEINDLDIKSYGGRITLVEERKHVKQCVDEIRKHNIIGFDTESKPNFSKNSNHKVSLIQLAIPGDVFLFRINKTGFTRELIHLFEDSELIKVGVSIHDDIKRLRALEKFEPENFIELQEMSNEYGIESNSLRKLTAIILGFRISKSQQLSNWEASQLTENQMVYAATDAWVSLEIYNKLSLMN